MIRLLTVVFMLVAVVSMAQVPSPSTPQILLEDGNIVGSTHPMPITSVATIGTASVDPNTPPTTNSTQIISVTTAAANVASIVNRRAITVINHSDTYTLWISLDSAVASAAANVGIPIFPYGSFSTELTSAKVLSIIAPAAATATVYQDGF